MSLSLGFKCNSLTRQKLVDRTVIAIGLGLKAETRVLKNLTIEEFRPSFMFSLFSFGSWT